MYWVVGLLTAAVLMYTVAEQIFDTNFYVLWEATALLAGDHPYRDFYQTGWPLHTAVSAVVQWIVGYRLIGEFLIHWSFILAGVLIGFHLALRLSGSMAASLATFAVMLIALASTGTFHFPKLFLYPCAVLVAWRYLDRPDAWRAATAGLMTAVAFFFRHDHGIYIGVASVSALGLARLAVPSCRTVSATVRDTIAYTAAAAIVVVPWAVLVQVNEGLIDYVRTRAAWGVEWAPSASAYQMLREIHPLRVLERQDPTSWRPSGEQGLRWLVQITALLPLLLLLSLGAEVVARRRRGRLVTPNVCATALAAGLVILVVNELVRQDSYFVVVLPLTAAFGARLLAGSRSDTPPIVAGVSTAARRCWRVVQRSIAVSMLLVTAVAAVGYLDWDLLSPNELDELAPTYRRLLTSPPIDAYQPADEARQMDVAAWQESDADLRQQVMIRYMYECTRADDRVLVTGSTPYHVGYYTERPIAGGHLQWHHGWRSDPFHEGQSLALMERQSVPFAFSTHDPVLDDFRLYPRVHAYLTEHYVEIEGSGGLLLADRRRQPTGNFGKLRLPCFR